MDYTRDNFPYIKGLKIHDCYAHQGLEFMTEPGEEPFQHIILTGRNGSGKTTVLKGIDFVLKDYNSFLKRIQGGQAIVSLSDHLLNRLEQIGGPHKGLFIKSEEFIQIFKVEPIVEEHEGWVNTNSQYKPFFNHFFDCLRTTPDPKIKGPKAASEYLPIEEKAGWEGQFSEALKQYLVNKFIDAAFSIMDNNAQKGERVKRFFSSFEAYSAALLEQRMVKLRFDRESFNTFFQYEDGREVTLSALPSGYSAALNVLLSLLVKVELWRDAAGKFEDTPCGIVLIDEPEVHLHLSMQEKILPLLTQFFPNIQFIVATHSPAVIASLENAFVYDLSSQESISGKAAGSSYSEIMVSHLGLSNDFSDFADRLLKQADQAIIDKKPEQLRKLLEENERFLTPSLILELESHAIELEAEQDL